MTGAIDIAIPVTRILVPKNYHARSLCRISVLFLSKTARGCTRYRVILVLDESAQSEAFNDRREH
jgi:hypothetical protein